MRLSPPPPHSQHSFPPRPASDQGPKAANPSISNAARTGCCSLPRTPPLLPHPALVFPLPSPILISPSFIRRVSSSQSPRSRLLSSSYSLPYSVFWWVHFGQRAGRKKGKQRPRGVLFACNRRRRCLCSHHSRTRSPSRRHRSCTAVGSPLTCYLPLFSLFGCGCSPRSASRCKT